MSVNSSADAPNLRAALLLAGDATPNSDVTTPDGEKWMSRAECAARARSSLPAAAYAVVTSATFLTLVFFHSFASPAAEFSTCAASLADGVCASAGGASCLFRCPPRCDDFWVDAGVYTVFGSNSSYRADSFLCRSAIHAGVLGADGGCALAGVLGPSGLRGCGA